MPESIAETVDSVNAQDAVDSAAETMEEIPSAEESSPKTYTADELDAAIKKRIDKQNARHADEMAELAQKVRELEERSAKAEAEREALQRKQDLSEWANAAAEAHGVPARLLRGNSAEEFMEHAAAIKASFGVAPVVRDSGEPKQPPKSNQSVFDDFMKSNFS